MRVCTDRMDDPSYTSCPIPDPLLVLAQEPYYSVRKTLLSHKRHGQSDLGLKEPWTPATSVTPTPSSVQGSGPQPQ